MTSKTPMRSVRQTPLLASFFAFVLLGTGFAQEIAPALELNDFNGQPQNLENYRGKIVVLNFWATWCGPCAGEMPRFVETQALYQDRGVVVLAVSLDPEETKSQIPDFIKKYKMDFPVLVGGTIEHLHAYGMGDGLPGTVFLDRDGRIFARILGEAKKKDVFARVDWLLGNRPGKNPKPPKPLIGHMLKLPPPKPTK